jgi:tetratricopeptide (TPR) repeat protein
LTSDSRLSRKFRVTVWFYCAEWSGSRGNDSSVTPRSRIRHGALFGAVLALASANARADDAPRINASRASSNGTKTDDLAQSPEKERVPPSTGVHSESSRRAERTAEAAYQQAQACYAKNDVPGALESMSESYRLSQRPELLYNLALLEQELQHCQAALDDFAAYLQRAPQGRYRDAAEHARTELTRVCPIPETVHAAPLPPGQIKPAPVLTVPKNDQPSVSRAKAAYWTPSRVIGWSAITAGVLAGGGALYFSVSARASRNEYQQSVDAQYNGGPPRDLSLEAAQHRKQALAEGLTVSGCALVAGGILAMLLTPNERKPSETRAFIDVEPGRLVAFYLRSF